MLADLSLIRYFLRPQPLMLQLTATNSYGYHPTENGYLCVVTFAQTYSPVRSTLH